ncbi:MAG: tetratricopeptide repeat protein [Thermoanaerobaculia bacterium]
MKSNRKLRGMLVLSTVATAAWSLYAVVLLPYDCNIVLKSAKARSAAAAEADNPVLIATLARQSQTQLAPCRNWCESNVDALMVSALNYRLLRQYDAAIRVYDNALTLDIRPELLLNRGLAKMEKGHREDGLLDLLAAARLDIRTAWAIGNPTLRDEIKMQIFDEWNAQRRAATAK